MEEKEIKENKWDKKLKNFKGVIIGGSAGAIIFVKDVDLALYGKIKDKNIVKLKNTKGINLVNGYNLKCHYFQEEKNLVLKFIKKTKGYFTLENIQNRTRSLKNSDCRQTKKDRKTINDTFC